MTSKEIWETIGRWAEDRKAGAFKPGQRSEAFKRLDPEDQAYADIRLGKGDAGGEDAYYEEVKDLWAKYGTPWMIEAIAHLAAAGNGGGDDDYLDARGAFLAYQLEELLKNVEYFDAVVNEYKLASRWIPRTSKFCSPRTPFHEKNTIN